MNKLAKFILALFVLSFIAIFGFAQTTASAKTEQVAKPEKKLTSADSITSTAPFELTTKKQLADIDEKLEKLSKEFDDLSKERNSTLKTAYGIYCDQKKLDQVKITVKGITKDGIIIQMLK